MRIWFSQVYIEAGVVIPFSHGLQQRLSRTITELASPSAAFIEKYGDNINLIINISAKKRLTDNEIRGPAVYKNAKEIEYVIFLPFDEICSYQKMPDAALSYLLDGVCDVFRMSDIDYSKIIREKNELIKELLRPEKGTT